MGEAELLYELRRQKEMNRNRCPQCGSDRWEVTSFSDFRYSNTGYGGRKCLSCGHRYEIVDLCTG
jgi:DNA-directed RNA polymerase subunit RPC12/RpoP